MAKGNASLVDWPKARTILHEFQRGCDTPLPLLQTLVDDMHSQMLAGLSSSPSATSLAMLLTFVKNLPSGKESGVYYGLDLGGTNLRVLRIRVAGEEHRITDMEQQEVPLPVEIRTGSNDDLFDFMADALHRFITEEGPEFRPAAGQKRKLGFTFSFPVCLQSINSGILLKWTKGFAIQETLGREVTGELNAALQKRGLDMSVNDTVATLAGGRYWNKDVMVGVIVGTGSNACYVERTENVPKWPPSGVPRPESTVIDMEWGSFSSPYLPKTSVDHDLDKDFTPGEHEFEKLFSGMYMGEVVRRLLLKLAQEASLFGGSIPDKMTEQFSLKTPLVSAMHEDESHEMNKVVDVLTTVFDLEASDIPLEVRTVVVQLCNIVAVRGARLVATGIVAILKKIGVVDRPKRTVVAIDGSMYEQYPKFRACLHHCLAELLDPKVAESVVLELFKDASGIGGALLAASHANSG